MAAGSRSHPLTVDRIVDAACGLVAREGVAKFSMRRLGAELGVDPMAVYHHVADKRALLRLVTERAVATMPAPDADATWDTRIRQWATRYWEFVVAHRDLTLAGLADPEIAAGGQPATDPLMAAVAASSVDADLVTPLGYLVVDAVHGSALSVTAAGRESADGVATLRRAFEVGLDTIIAGIAARAGT